MITKNLSGKRENKLSVNSWKLIYKKVQNSCSKIHPNLNKVVEKIQSIMLTEYPGKKSKIPNISSKILSNWIFETTGPIWSPDF